jgi:hypothetical protein
MLLNPNAKMGAPRCKSMAQLACLLMRLASLPRIAAMLIEGARKMQFRTCRAPQHPNRNEA